MERCTRLDLLRHGACEDGAIYRGRTDSALSPAGWQQLRSATQGGSWDRIVSSPLQRCQAFAEELAERLSVPLTVAPGLVELDFGLWDGEPLAEVWMREADRVTAFWRDPDHNPPPAGETLSGLQQRALAVIEPLYQQFAGQRLLVLTHSGVIRVLLAHWLKMPLASSQQLAVDYGGLTRVACYVEAGQLTGVEVRFVNRLGGESRA